MGRRLPTSQDPLNCFMPRATPCYKDYIVLNVHAPIKRKWLGENDIDPLLLFGNLFLLQAEKINYQPSDIKLVWIFHRSKYITMSGNLSSFKLELKNGYQTSIRHYHLHTFHLKRFLKLCNTPTVNCSSHSFQTKLQFRLGRTHWWLSWLAKAHKEGIFEDWRRVWPVRALWGFSMCSCEGGKLYKFI